MLVGKKLWTFLNTIFFSVYTFIDLSWIKTIMDFCQFLITIISEYDVFVILKVTPHLP